MKATYTQWSTFDACPYWYQRQYLDQDVKRRTSEALEKGIRVHEGIEKFLLKESDLLPTEIHPSWVDFLEGLQNYPGLRVETRLENDVAYGKLDVYVPGEILLDFKTGKARLSDIKIRDQLRFYVWLTGESMERAELAWVEHPFQKAHLSLEIPWNGVLDRVWRQRIDKMKTGPYEPTPNWKCRFCPVHDCPHNEANQG